VSKVTVFIVDDDPDVVESLRIVLEAEGYSVQSAPSGKEALAKLSDVNPDLIILDVMMEYDTDGFRTAWALRNTSDDSPYAEHRGVPILMLTSIGSVKRFTFSPDKDGDLLPVDEYIPKPVHPRDLLARVRSLLSGRDDKSEPPPRAS
jgi:DNA-binding response OmpR family regulator